MSMRKLAQRLKTAGPYDLSLQLFQPVPGTPLALRTGESRDDRLPGMRRWVERDMIERAMAAQDSGIPPEAYALDEHRRSLLRKSLGGALLGGVAGASIHSELKAAPLKAILLGSLLGGGVGYATHAATTDDREADAQSAYIGAENDRRTSALPLSRQHQSSAAATTPVLMHTGPSVA